ncbi:hypothetical protein BH20ACI1_BH20ACI1_09100 [soil metagenome]
MRLLENNKKAIYRTFGTMVILLSSFIFLTSCADSASDIADKKGGVTANQIIENPTAYVGKTVTVSGDVEEIHGPRAFNMDSGASIGELLVVGREPFPQLPDAGDRVYVINDVATVTGVIRMMDDKGFKDEIGWDLDANLLSDFKGKPVLVAQKVGFKAGKGSVAATPNNDQTKMNTNVEPMNDGKMTTGDKLADIGIWTSTADKSTLVGKNAEFSNLKVVRVVGPRTFTVNAGKDELYVMLDDNSARQVGTQGKIDVGDTLNLTGEFQALKMEEIKDTANDRFRPLTDTEREFMKKTSVYFNVNNVSKLK